jgi:hypothetical protein
MVVGVIPAGRNLHFFADLLALIFEGSRPKRAAGLLVLLSS